MSNQMPSSAVIFCPAKVNPFLAVTGLRQDGYHDLLSVAAPLDFGDYLWVKRGAVGESDTLECDNPDLETGPSNLVLQASAAFRKSRKLEYCLHYQLQKRIPVGAGFGGGSSNAAAVLRLLNSFLTNPLPEKDLLSMGADLGSDVPLFLSKGPVIMRGRGEQIENLPVTASRRLSGRRVLLFRPEFSIETAWAYGCLAANSSFYLSASQSVAKLDHWLESDQSLDELLFNSFEIPIFEKFLTYPTIYAMIGKMDGISPLLSGSGSACLALYENDESLALLKSAIENAWGAEAFMVESVFL